MHSGIDFDRLGSTVCIVFCNIFDLQVGLGITTLLLYVPTYLGAMHQCGSLVLLSLATWLTHELKHIKRVAK